MAICKKCGARIEEDLKYCDKCGSEININDTEDNIVIDTVSDTDIVNETKEKSSASLVEQIENTVHSFLPHPFTKKGDRTSLLIGIGSLAALAITYIICFFSFMPEICLPIGFDVMGVDSASSLWLIAYFAFNLFTAFFAVKAFLVKKYRLYAIFVSAGVFVLTVFALIFWGMCEPGNYTEALGMYQESAGSVAWFAFVDCLSEAWYLKIILSLASVFGFGVDYIVNKGN